MTGNFLPLLADRILNRPLLLHPDKAATVLHVLEGRIVLGALDETKPEASRFIGTRDREDGRSSRLWTRAAGKTALITVDGSLVNRGAWVGASSGLTSYEGIGAQLDEVAAEARAGNLHNLVIDMNSYGGEATGMAGLASKIRNLRKTMHVVAVVNDVAASAGYGIVSSADQIVISPTSLVGSIGVVMMHLDRSGEMLAKGVRPTLIHAGAKKVDGNPFGPLPESVRADMQKDVLAFYEQFLATIEAGRGKARLSAKKARETEADVFIGQEAIDAGLADRIGTLEDVLAELSRPVRSAGKQPSSRGMKMEREDLPTTSAGMHTDTALRAAVSKAEADGKAVGTIEGKKEGHAEGVKAERERVAAILNSDEGKARPQAAIKIALAPEAFSAETARSVLAGFPAEANLDANASTAVKPVATTTPIHQRSETNVEIGATGPAPAAPEAAKSGWGKAVANANKGFAA